MTAKSLKLNASFAEIFLHFKLLYAGFRKILGQFFSLMVGIVLYLINLIYSMVVIVLKALEKSCIVFASVLLLCLQDTVLYMVAFRR